MTNYSCWYNVHIYCHNLPDKIQYYGNLKNMLIQCYNMLTILEEQEGNVVPFVRHVHVFPVHSVHNSFRELRHDWHDLNKSLHTLQPIIL